MCSISMNLRGFNGEGLYSIHLKTLWASRDLTTSCIQIVCDLLQFYIPVHNHIVFKTILWKITARPCNLIVRNIQLLLRPHLTFAFQLWLWKMEGRFVWFAFTTLHTLALTYKSWTIDYQVLNEFNIAQKVIKTNLIFNHNL